MGRGSTGRGERRDLGAVKQCVQRGNGDAGGGGEKRNEEREGKEEKRRRKKKRKEGRQRQHRSEARTVLCTRNPFMFFTASSPTCPGSSSENSYPRKPSCGKRKPTRVFFSPF